MASFYGPHISPHAFDNYFRCKMFSFAFRSYFWSPYLRVYWSFVCFVLIFYSADWIALLLIFKKIAPNMSCLYDNSKWGYCRTFFSFLRFYTTLKTVLGTWYCVCMRINCKLLLRHRTFRSEQKRFEACYVILFIVTFVPLHTATGSIK